VAKTISRGAPRFTPDPQRSKGRGDLKAAQRPLSQFVFAAVTMSTEFVSSV
jgi:hypothetical protein